MKIMESTSSKEEVSALARGLALVRAVADADGPLGNRELVDATGIPKATISRLVTTLIGAGYLRQADGSERYSLGPALLQLGNDYLRGFDFRNVARLHLAELAELAGANVHLAVRDCLDVLLIDTLRPRSALILSRMDVGSRMSIATSAAGRSYFASLAADEQRALRKDLKATSKNWKATEARLDESMAEYAKRGFCSSFGEWHPDIHALGFSLRGPRGELYAVSVGGPAFMLPTEMLLTKVAPKLLETKRAIGREIGVT